MPLIRQVGHLDSGVPELGPGEAVREDGEEVLEVEADESRDGFALLLRNHEAAFQLFLRHVREHVRFQRLIQLERLAQGHSTGISSACAAASADTIPHWFLGWRVKDVKE